MRHGRIWLAGFLAAAWVFGMPAARAADEAPIDPTRGHLTFLDPIRDLEDQLSGTQKSFEEATKIHVGVGTTKSYLWNFNVPSNNINTLHTLDPDHNSANWDLFQLNMSRPSEGWFVPGFGMKLDWGRIAKRIKPDYNGNGAVAVGDTFEKSDFDVEELYATWTVPEDSTALKGLTLKGGKFVTLLGAEVIEPWANPIFSRSFLFGFAIPFTHTGGLVSYPLTDKLSVTAGPVIGWDNFKDNNSDPSYMGNVTYAAMDQVTLAANGIWGPEQTHRVNAKRGVVDLVATLKPTPELTFLLNYDWGHEEGLTPGNGSVTWQGFSGIASYSFTERCSASLRGEWFEDPNGARTGVKQSLWETTLDTKYLFTQHFYTRLEYRHDEGSQKVFLADSTKTTHGQDILGAEFTYLFN
jgi:hypothetical protein